MAATDFPPNWYTDPWGSGQLRWWDGVQWTPHLQSAPLTPVAAAPTQAAQDDVHPAHSAKPRLLDEVGGAAAGLMRNWWDGQRLARSRGGAWVPAGEDVVVHGYRIQGGLLYAGPGLKALCVDAPEPALVDPRLEVDRRHPDTGGAGLGYWPSYSELAPQTRAAYLQWLAAGRDDPGTPIGFVFLYFYGLERRLWEIFGGDDDPANEVATIHDEVVRLLMRYGGRNASFLGYGLTLVDLIQCLVTITDGSTLSDTDPDVLIPDDLADLNRRGLPLVVHMAAARLSVAGAPLPAAWAYAWWLRHPETRVPNQLKRAPHEFRLMFLRRYTAKFGAGMILAPKARPFALEYRPASLTFGGTLTLRFTELPNIASTIGPYRKLAAVAGEAATELDAYVRFVSRRPEQAGTLAAAAAMPQDLFDDLYGGPDGAALVELDQWLGGLCPGDDTLATIGTAELVARWPAATPGALTKSENVAFLTLLGRLGWGVEPDVRFGGANLSKVNRAVLFHQGRDAPEAPTTAWTAASVLLHLAVTVAAADGTVDDTEKEAMARHVEEALGLGDLERRRLHARLALLLLCPPTLAAAKRQLDAFGYEQRKQVGETLIGIAAADGEVSTKEVRLLRRVFTLLDIPPDAIDAAADGELPGAQLPEPTSIRTLSSIVAHDTTEAEAVTPPMPPIATGAVSEASGEGAPSVTTPPAALQSKDVYKRTQRSVVGISDGEDVLGTGFFIRNDSLVVTNAHVVEELPRVRVQLADGDSADAQVIAVLTAADLAFLRVPPSGLEPLALADATGVCVGDTVYAIGNPFGLLHTFTKGMVSAIGRDLRDKRVLQTDTPVNPGNSGGPLLDEHANVVGVVVMKNMLADGLGFAIPVDVLAHHLTTIPAP